jgi:hypothetical protein
MKKIIFLIVVTLFGSQIYAQQVVHDPAANASLTQSVQQGLQSLQLSNEQLTIAKKGLESMDKVNKLLKQTKLVGSIKDNLEITYINLEGSSNKIKKIKFKALNDKLMKMTKDLVIDVDVFKDLLMDVLKDDVLKMNDSERMELLMKLFDRSKELKSKSLNLSKHLKNASNL